MSSVGIRGKNVMWHKGSTAEHTRKIEKSKVLTDTERRNYFDV